MHGQQIIPGWTQRQSRSLPLCQQSTAASVQPELVRQHGVQLSSHIIHVKHTGQPPPHTLSSERYCVSP